MAAEHDNDSLTNKVSRLQATVHLQQEQINNLLGMMGAVQGFMAEQVKLNESQMIINSGIKK